MINIDEIVELFDEVEFGCEYGALGIVKCEDGFWFCNRDVDVLSSQIEFKKANISMQEALRVSQLDEDELFLEQENLRIEEIKMSYEQPSRNEVEILNRDYYGTHAQIINETMAGAFDVPFGNDFSL